MSHANFSITYPNFHIFTLNPLFISTVGQLLPSTLCFAQLVWLFPITPASNFNWRAGMQIVLLKSFKPAICFSLAILRTTTYY